MKKLVCLLLTILTAVCILSACARSELIVINESDDFVVITCEKNKDGLTLAECMQENGGEFVIENGMVISINGLENASDWSKVWMLYTDDEELSNTAWGTVEYNGKVYASAIYGAESLIVKKGCTYIWLYKSFE